MKITQPLFLLWCLLSVATLRASGVADLWQNALVLTDSTNQLTLSDILAFPDEAFTTPGTSTRPFSNHLNTWVRFSVATTKTDTSFLYLHKAADTAMVWRGATLVGLTGKNVSYTGRMGVDGDNGLNLPPDGSVYHIKLVNGTTSFKLRSITDFTLRLFNNRASYQEYLIDYKKERTPYHNAQRAFLLLIAVVLGMIILSFLILRDAAFGWYAVYVATILLFYLLRRSYLLEDQFFFVRTGIKYAFEPVWIPVIFLAYSRFVRSFLGLTDSLGSTRLYHWLRLIERVALIIIAVTLGVLLIFGLYWANTFGVIARFGLIGMAVYAVALLLRRRDRFSQIISFGIGLLITGISLIIVNDVLRYLYHVDIEPGSLSFFQYAVVAELLLYWVGLLYRWYDIRVANEARIDELETLREQLRLRDEAASITWLSIATARKKYRWARTQVQGFVAERELTSCLLTGGVEQRIPLRLGELEEQLPEGFLRVQRSYIVCINHIVRYEEGSTCRVYLAGRPEGITVGRKQRAAVSEALEEFGG